MAIRSLDRDTAQKREERIAKRRAVWNKSGGRCFYCGVQTTAATFTLDHLVPRARGGSDDLHNLVPACATCNGMKGDGPLEDLRSKLRFKLAGMPPFSESQMTWIKERFNEQVDPGPQPFWFEHERRGDVQRHPPGESDGHGLPTGD